MSPSCSPHSPSCLRPKPLVLWSEDPVPQHHAPSPSLLSLGAGGLSPAPQPPHPQGAGWWWPSPWPFKPAQDLVHWRGRDLGVQAGSTHHAPAVYPVPEAKRGMRADVGSLCLAPVSPAIPLRPQTCSLHRPNQSCAVRDPRLSVQLPKDGSTNSQPLLLSKPTLEALIPLPTFYS